MTGKCGYCGVALIGGEFCSEYCRTQRELVHDNVLLWFEETSTSIIRPKIDPKDVNWRVLEEIAPQSVSTIRRLRDMYSG